MTASYTYLSNGSYDVLYAGVTGESYSAYEMHYGSNGKPVTAFYDNGMMATWTYNPNGTHSIEYDGVTGQPTRPTPSPMERTASRRAPSTTTE